MKIVCGREINIAEGSQWPETETADCWLIDVMMCSNYFRELKLKINMYIY